MAEETQARGSRAVRLGAAQAAPTAPHATPRPKGPGRATGPERFWKVVPWYVGAASIAVSLVVHYALSPWSLLPKQEFEFHDVDGTLTIPVDLMNAEPPPAAPPPAAVPPAPDPVPSEVHEPSLDASAPKKRPPVRDAGADGSADASDAEPSDAIAGEGGDERGEEGGPSGADAAVAVATGEDGGGAKGARDAVGMIGAAGTVQAGPQNVVLTVNMAALRLHPEGKRLGPLITAVPQWNDFLEGTRIDPMRDIDWISINGPALIHTEKDVILVHYAASDADVDKAVTALSQKHGTGGRVDVGVPGVKAVRGYADNAERVFVRPQPHVLAVVPRDYAKTAAKILVHASVPRALRHPDEAFRLTLVHPHGPMRRVPEAITEVRVWIVPRDDDGSADIYGEGDTASADAARAAVDALEQVVEAENSFGVQILTRGLLNHVEIHAEGPEVRFHVPVSRDQIEVVLAFVGGRLGVPMPPLPPEPEAAPSSGGSAPPPSPARAPGEGR